MAIEDYDFERLIRPHLSIFVWQFLQENPPYSISSVLDGARIEGNVAWQFVQDLGALMFNRLAQVGIDHFGVGFGWGQNDTLSSNANHCAFAQWFFCSIALSSSIDVLFRAVDT